MAARTLTVNGVRKACQGRPVGDDDLAVLAQQVEEHMRASGQAQIEAHEVGLAILGPLRRLDEIAYLRFASVYQGFETLDDFEAAIALLRAERDMTSSDATHDSPGHPGERGDQHDHDISADTSSRAHHGVLEGSHMTPRQGGTN